MRESNFGVYLDNHYKQKLIEQLSIEPYLAKAVREEAELKEHMIKDNMHPILANLAERFKWKWLVRQYRFEEEYGADKKTIKLYKRNKLLANLTVDLGPTITFKRY